MKRKVETDVWGKDVGGSLEEELLLCIAIQDCHLALLVIVIKCPTTHLGAQGISQNASVGSVSLQRIA